MIDCKRTGNVLSDFGTNLVHFGSNLVLPKSVQYSVSYLAHILSNVPNDRMPKPCK